jgi:glycosyltransferase involved in cell wall biosynthesis
MTQPGAESLPRVLVVTTRLDIGGTEQHLLRILPRLRGCGLDISLFVLERGGSLEGELAGAGVDIAGPLRRLPRHLHALAAGLHLRRQLRRQRPDIVHFFLSEPYIVGSAAAFGMRDMRRIMSRRSLNAYQSKHPTLARLERWLHGGTSVLLGNSSAVVSDLRGECNDAGKIGLIRNGLAIPDPVSSEKCVQARRLLGLPTETFVVAINANLIPYKGHADFFEALAIIQDKLPAAWRLLLIGRDQGVEAGLRDMAGKSGIADNLVWLGERADAQDLLSAADVCVLPSHEEGFSNSLIEAMGQGLPVIATAVGGNVDAVTHEKTGLLVPARNPEALAVALLRLSKDAGFRQQLGSAARERVVSHFSIDDCVARYLNLYRGWRVFGRQPVQGLIDARYSALADEPAGTA